MGRRPGFFPSREKKWNYSTKRKEDGGTYVEVYGEKFSHLFENLEEFISHHNIEKYTFADETPAELNARASAGLVEDNHVQHSLSPRLKNVGDCWRVVIHVPVFPIRPGGT